MKKNKCILYIIMIIIIQAFNIFFIDSHNFLVMTRFINIHLICLVSLRNLIRKIIINH